MEPELEIIMNLSNLVKEYKTDIENKEKIIKILEDHISIIKENNYKCNCKILELEAKLKSCK